MEGLTLTIYHAIPNRSTGDLDKSPVGGCIRLREPGGTVTNMIYNSTDPQSYWVLLLGGVPILGIIRYWMSSKVKVIGQSSRFARLKRVIFEVSDVKIHFAMSYDIM